MGIIFREDRQLPGGGEVKAGKLYDTFSPEDEQAFVDNGVAEFAPAAETGKKQPVPKGGE